MYSNTLTIRGREVSPSGRQAAIVTSVYDDGSYSLDLTSRILDKEEYEKVILEKPLTPYAIEPKSKSFKTFIGRINNRLRVVGFLGVYGEKFYWMVKCTKCNKYSIREGMSWNEKFKKNEKEFCYNCEDRNERSASKMVNKFKDKCADKKIANHNRRENKNRVNKPIKRFSGTPSKLGILKSMSDLFADYVVK